MADPPSPAIRPERIQSLQGAVAPALALLAGMQLDLFSAIGEEAGTAAEIAASLGVEAERLERLLLALAHLGLLEFDGSRFGNGAEAKAFLVRGRPGFMGDEHELLAELWRADLETAASIREGRPAAKHDFSVADEAASAAFFRGLLPSTVAFGRELAAAVDMSGIGSVLDIGGGPGGALLALRERWPHLRLTLLELPAGIGLAKGILAGDPRAEGIGFEEGDILQGPSAQTHDAAILKAVIQVLSRERAKAAIRNAHASLNPGGTLFIAGGGILDDGRLSPRHAVLYNLTFMNLYEAGESYTRSEYAGWLNEAGFAAVDFRTMPSGGTLIVARRT